MTSTTGERSRPSQPVLVYATAPTLEVAERIAAALVDEHLVACANILPGVVSIYRWQGARRREGEVAMVMKSTRDRAEAVVARTKELHPYETPAVVVIDIAAGNPDFLAWIGETTRA